MTSTAATIIFSTLLRYRAWRSDKGYYVMLIREAGHYAVRTMHGTWGLINTHGQYKQFDKDLAGLEKARQFFMSRMRMKTQRASGAYLVDTPLLVGAEATDDEAQILLERQTAAQMATPAPAPQAAARTGSPTTAAERHRQAIYAGFAVAAGDCTLALTGPG